MSNYTDITKHFSLEFWEYLEKVIDTSHQNGNVKCTVWNLISELVSSSRIKSLLEENQLKLIQVNLKTKILTSNGNNKNTITSVDDELFKFILYSYLVTQNYNRLTVKLEDAFLALISFPITSAFFNTCKISEIIISKMVSSKLGGNNLTGTPEIELIDKFSKNISFQVENSNIEIIGRTEEIGQIIRILMKQTSPNIILVGEDGIGKESIIYGVAKELRKNKSSNISKEESLSQTDIVKLNLANFSNNFGKERIFEVVDEIINSSKITPKILFIEDIHILTNSYNQNNSEYSIFQSAIRNALVNNEIKLIGTTSTSNFKKFIESDSILLTRFEILRVYEPNSSDTVEICKIKSSEFEKFHNVKIQEDTIFTAVELSKKYLTEKFLPLKAIDLLDEASTLNSGSIVTPDSIRRILADKTGIPIEKLSQDEKQKLVGLEATLEKEVKGQEVAIHKVCEVIRRARAGLKDSKKPIGSFLFLGPSGVGKTELAKTIAKAIYDTPKAMVRIDMSEFSESHTVQRLLGAPPGYVGYEEGGQLTNPIWERPYSLILLDEIEKAHPKVFDIFLQVLDDGRLTDGQGRTVDFRNTIIIATSNIGSELMVKNNTSEIVEYMTDLNGNKISSKNGIESTRRSALASAFGFNTAVVNKESTINDLQKEKMLEESQISVEEIMPILKQYFRPEFINRFDEIIIFNPLSKSVLAEILELQLKTIEEKLKEQNVTIELTPETKNEIIQKAYNPLFGARPILREVQEKVENYIARGLINGSIPTNSKVKI